LRKPRARREYRLSRLANAIGRDVRTIRRWLDERPDLRPIIRATKDGKNWRLDYPHKPTAFRAYVGRVRSAVARFTNAPLLPPARTNQELFARSVKNSVRISNSSFGDQADAVFQSYFGLGDTRIEQDSDVLGIALDIIRFKLPTLSPEQTEEPDVDLDFLWLTRKGPQWGKRLQDPQFVEGVIRLLQMEPDEWKQLAEEIKLEARRLAVANRCPVKDVLRFWSTPSGSARYSLLKQRQILEILWPSVETWRKAETMKRLRWEEETLAKAVYELFNQKGNVPAITGRTLAPLLFRNPEEELHYRNYWARAEDLIDANRLNRKLYEITLQELQYESRPPGYRRQAHARPNGRFGERGISRAEFFKRYKREDIQNAIRNARCADGT